MTRRSAGTKAASSCCSSRYGTGSMGSFAPVAIVATAGTLEAWLRCRRLMQIRRRVLARASRAPSSRRDKPLATRAYTARRGSFASFASRPVFRPLHVASCKVQCSHLQHARDLPAGRPDARGARAHRPSAGRVAPQGRARRDAVSRRRSLRVAVRRLDRLLQDRRQLEAGPRAGHRLPDGGRADRPRRHRFGPPRGRRDRARGLAGLRHPLRRALEGARTRGAGVADAVPQDDEPRNRDRPPGRCCSSAACTPRNGSPRSCST